MMSFYSDSESIATSSSASALTPAPSDIETPTIISSHELEALSTDLSPNDSSRFEKKRYIRAASLKLPTGKEKSSGIWKHNNGTEWVRVADRKKYRRCEHCFRKKRTELLLSSSTHSA